MFDGHQRNKPRSSQSESSIQVQPSGKAEKYGQRRAAVSLKVDERVLKQWPGKSNDQQQISVTKKGTTRQLRSSSSSSAKESPPSSATIQLITSDSSTEELPFSSLSIAQVEPRVGPNSSSSVESDNSENCDRGTPVTLEAVVWHESEGLLVVKVMWRNKVFVGSLMDSTTHQWTPLNRKETERMGPRTRTMRKAHGLSNSLSTIRKQSLRRGFLSNETSGLEASSGAGHSRTRGKVIDTKQQPQEKSIETRDASHTASDDSPKASKRSRLFPKSNTISSDGATPSSIVTDELAVGTFPIPPLIPINPSSSLSTTATTNSEDVRDSVNPISNDRPPPLTKETCKETTFQGGSSFYQNDIPLDLAGNHPSPNIDELDRTGIENPPFPPITQGTVLREHCNLREDSQGVSDSDEDLEIIYENLHQPFHLEFKEKLQFIGGNCMENQMNHKMHQQHPNPKMEFLNLPAREPYRQNEIFPDNGRTAYSVDQPLMNKFSDQIRMGSIEMGCCKRSTKLTTDSRPFSQRFFTKNPSDPQPEMQNKANIESTPPSPANNI